VPGPLGDAVPAAVLKVGATAYVEAAQAIGAHLLPPGGAARAVSHGTSEGVGRLLLAARATGAARIVVGLGTAAVCDAGAGALLALGLGQAALGGGARGLAALTAGDLHGLVPLRERWAGQDVVAACAGARPLTGPGGAAGAAAARGVREGVEAFAAAAGAALRATAPARAALPVHGGGGRAIASPLAPRTGAGGGLGFAIALLGGRLLDGADVVADAVALADAVARADLVVTGGRRVDDDELHLGVVGVVARAGLAAGVPVVAVAGEVEVSRRALAAAGVAGAYAVHQPPGPYAAPSAGTHGTAVSVDSLAARTRRVAVTWSPSRRP
jgi:glycerate kinase